MADRRGVGHWLGRTAQSDRFVGSTSMTGIHHLMDPIISSFEVSDVFREKDVEGQECLAGRVGRAALYSVRHQRDKFPA